MVGGGGGKGVCVCGGGGFIKAAKLHRNGKVEKVLRRQTKKL